MLAEKERKDVSHGSLIKKVISYVNWFMPGNKNFIFLVLAVTDNLAEVSKNVFWLPTVAPSSPSLNLQGEGGKATYVSQLYL